MRGFPVASYMICVFLAATSGRFSRCSTSAMQAGRCVVGCPWPSRLRRFLRPNERIDREGRVGVERAEHGACLAVPRFL